MSSNVQDLYPLSPLQQGMLFHAIYAPDAGLYVDHIHFTLQGDLDASAFERAWQQVVARHPILRSAFVWEDVKEPLQVVLKEIDLPFEIHDWRAVSAAAQEVRLQEYLNAVRASGFDLAEPPLMRLSLLRVADDVFEFVWNVHHLLLDGWSVSLLLRELMMFYEMYSRGQALDLPQSRPYRDYIGWLQQQDAAQAESFWRQALAGITTPTPLEIGSAPQHTAEEDAQPGYRQCQTNLSEQMTSDLNAVARQHRLTLNTLVQGAWALLLNRYSGNGDVVFGAVVSGRPSDLAGSESMVGMFINTLPVRVTVPHDAQLLSWLESLQGTAVCRAPI